MNPEPTGEDACSTYTLHKSLMSEKGAQQAHTKESNVLYLPLLASTLKAIEDNYARQQFHAAVTLLGKCVYIQRGTTSATSCFTGQMLVERISRSDNHLVCVYIGGHLVSECGSIYEDLMVQVAIHANTYISYK